MNDRTNTVLLWVVIGVGVALLLCCGIGLGVFVWVGRSVTMDDDFGPPPIEEVIEVDVVDENDPERIAAGYAEFDWQVQQDIKDHPLVVEHIGAIAVFHNDLDLSSDEPGDVWVFHISGDKGSGMLRANCVTIDNWTEHVDSGQLTLDTGEVYELFPDNPISLYQ